ncbi:MAG: quinol:cytochrome C oxidoreductase, partial [Bacteroidota bacterium]
MIEPALRKFSPKIRLIGWGFVWLGVALYALGYIVDAREAAFNNALSFLYLTSIGIGALFFIALEYISGAVWSVPIRRVHEFLAQLIPFAALLAVPLLFNLDDLFVWARKDIMASDAMLRLKEPYLNQTFFIARFIGIFIVWKIFIRLLTRNSMRQDATADPRLTKINTILSAFFMPVFAVTLTTLAVDWGMSLEPHWYSTIYGIYFFAGTAIA